jgi:hypothetical protein
LLLSGGVGFDVEVVVSEEGGGVGFLRGAEGEVDVVLADRFEPDGVGQVVGIVVLGADGFVDDVPGMDAAFVAAGDGENVGAEEFGGILRSRDGVEPRGIVLVPAEIVAASEEMIGFGEGHVGVGLSEVEAIMFGMRCAPLHLIFGDEDGALIEDEGGDVGAVKLGVGYGGAEKEFSVSGEVAKFGKGGRLQSLRQGTSGERSYRKLEEITTMHKGKRIKGLD